MRASVAPAPHHFAPSARMYSLSTPALKKAWDPSLDKYKYWNREESKKGTVRMF